MLERWKVSSIKPKTKKWWQIVHRYVNVLCTNSSQIHLLDAHGMCSFDYIQVNLCQKLLFMDQLTHNMTTDCSLNYKFNTWKFQAQNMGRTCCVQKLFLTFRTIYVHNMFSPCSTNIRAPDKDLHVCTSFLTFRSFEFRNFWFTMVYNSILFSSPLVLLSNLNLPGFCFRVFLCVPTLTT